MAAKMQQAAYIREKRSMPAFSFQWLNWLLPLLLVLSALFWAEHQLSKPQTLPVKKIQVHGAFINLNEEMLHRAISNTVAGGYFNVDVEQIRKVVEQLPWVETASVRRVWPDTLSVNVVEQKPVAISKTNGLINKKGEVFKPLQPIKQNLPVFEGKAALNPLMLKHYYAMNEQLKAIDRKIVYLKFDDRHAIALKLDNGVKVMLGRGDASVRLQRMIKIYPRVLSARIDDIAVIDLRYTNGMAIAWKKKTGKNKAVAGDMNHV